MDMRPPKPKVTRTDHNGVSENMPLVTVLCYRGFEVIVAVGDDSTDMIFICARTRRVFDTVPIPCPAKCKNYVTILHTNSFTGLIAATTNLNEVFLFSPQICTEKPFGQYQWVPHKMLDSANVIDYFVVGGHSEKIASVSSCSNCRILISCGNTLAVFEAKHFNENMSISKDKSVPLLWSTTLPKVVLEADLSGDGNAIAVLVDDFDDNMKIDTFRYSASDSKDSLYERDVSLNLPYHITHISFRGRGFEWNDDIDLFSKTSKIIPTGNDLLLISSEKEGLSHVFSQYKWKECASWIGPTNSRTVWVQEIGIANLGDLDLNFTDQNSRSHAASVGGNDILSRSNHVKRQNLPPSKQSTEISALPGAWLAEVTVQGHYPALRLSHLVFGEDGSNLPELIEGPATILPASSLATASMMTLTNLPLWIQGLWPAWYKEDNFARDEGGTPNFLPPAEIRLVSALCEDSLSLLEIPLCMDEGIPETAEFRPPLRYILNIRPLHLKSRLRRQGKGLKPVCTDYMSSRLCAEISRSITDGRVIALTWIGEGSYFVSSSEIDSDLSHTFGDIQGEKVPLEKLSKSYLVDVSPMSLSIVLPSLRIGSKGDETIASLNWWPNQNFGGVPRLLVVTTSGTISLYELPSLWKALEPPIPFYDPLSESNHSMGKVTSTGSFDSDADSDDDLSLGVNDREYEVSLTPHPDFGIGLRLEAQQDGLPAIVGSYKKHPLSGGRLPAERNGMIMVGDELIAVNDETLCNKSFDEIIAAVRRIGSNANEPLRMRFRSTIKYVEESDVASTGSNGSRRTTEDILGVKAKKTKKKKRIKPSSDEDDASIATGVMMFVGSDLKPAEWVKTLSKSRDAFKEISPICCASVLPMNYGIGSPDKNSGVSAMLIVATGKNSMITGRLELDEVSEQSNFEQLGFLKIQTKHDIMHITPVKTATSGWCLAATDKIGNVFLIFIDTEENDKKKIKASFRQYPIFQLETPISEDTYIMKAASTNFLATTNIGSTNKVAVWSSNPLGFSNEKDNYNYSKSVIDVDRAEVILDIQWVRSGFLDAHPWLLVFGKQSVFVYYRPGGQSSWKNIAELSYPIPDGSKFEGNVSPADAFPHLISCLRSLLVVNDERFSLVSDWNIDSIISVICADDKGVKYSLKRNVKPIYSWLSKWLSPDKSNHPIFSQKCSLSVIPLSKLAPKEEGEEAKNSLFSNPVVSENDGLCRSLQQVLKAQKSPVKDVLSTDNTLPLPLSELSSNEVEGIWAIGELVSHPPDFSNLDHAGELFLFAFSLTKILRCSKDYDHVFSIAPSAVLSALLSGSQQHILSSIRSSGLNMNWTTISAVMIPLWLRSERDLRIVTEEVAQYTFRSTKKAMDCMLFYVILNKKNMFINYAKADRSDEGQKLVTFLSNFDFSSQRGRSAIEKNAFSLLRKRRYFQAASFFLMAEPPMLTSALNVIITQMKDLSLAMLVARLMGVTTEENVSMLKTFTNFVSGDGNSSNFHQWKPDLGDLSTKVLESQGLELIEGNSCLESVILLWLNKKSEAIVKISSVCFEDPPIFSAETSSILSTLERINGLIDFTSRPFLLRQIMANKRIRWSTALQLSRALSRRGIELVSMKTLLQDTHLDINDEAKNVTTSSNDQNSLTTTGSRSQSGSSGPFVSNQSVDKETMSSIFDSYDVPNQTKALVNINNEGDMKSSIFDSYQLPKPTAPHGEEMSSSIFESFDTPFQKKDKGEALVPQKTAPPLSTMKSSIFDSFDVPSQKAGPIITSDVATMSSSIFDSFDVPVAKVTNQIQGDPFSTNMIDLRNNDDERNSQTTVHLSGANAIIPPLWKEWKETLLADIVARRIVREIGFIVSRLQGDLPSTPLKLWNSPEHNSILHDTAQLLQHRYEGDLLESIEHSLNTFCDNHNLEVDAVIENALLLVGCPNTARRIVIAVILYQLMKRMDLAEKLIQVTSQNQIRMCSTFALGNNGIVTRSATNIFLRSSLLARRQAAHISWQLELCLWLNRGGLFELSDCVQKEAIVAVRVGLMIAAWGRSYYDLEQLSKCEPDCSLSLSLAQELWRTMKSISLPTKNEVSGVHSGGWEFLVDCTRQEASQILMNRKPGSFLLRPHFEDSSVFTLSFRSDYDQIQNQNKDELPKEANEENKPSTGSNVQHAIVRLSDLGFRCGSFGPFPTLIKLLSAVSDSLPYGLLLDEPPVQALIKDEGKQPSPNSVLIRKLTMHSRPERYGLEAFQTLSISEAKNDEVEFKISRTYGAFAALLLMNNITKYFCAVVTGDVLNTSDTNQAVSENETLENDQMNQIDDFLLGDCGSLAESLVEDNKTIAVGMRTLRPVFEWRRSLETRLVPTMIPFLAQSSAASMNDISIKNYDVIIRKLIKPGSGVEVRTLRIGEGSHSAVVVLFSETEAIEWLLRTQVFTDKEEVMLHLNIMVEKRVIEPICLKELSALSSGKGSSHNSEVKDIRYRFVDPWEIESFEMTSRSDTQGAMLGRACYVRLNMTSVSRVTESVLNSIGGYSLVSSWSVNGGTDMINSAISHTLPPWERSSNGDCERFYDTHYGSELRRTNYMDSIRRHLYRNSIFRRLSLPQRFISIIQVELLDLKNLTSPGGAPSLIAYALIRLKRSGKGSPLTHRIRTLDSAATEPAKIDRSSGPNPSASWKSKTRFRFPLPENVDSYGVSPNKDREALFPGPPSMLQLSVYEKKFITDSRLGSADIKLDGLSEKACLEEWVPLRSGKDGVVWFARMRISLKFKLLCISSSDKLEDGDACPSVGLTKIKMLSQHGAYEDLQGHANATLEPNKRSVSTPDLLGYIVN